MEEPNLIRHVHFAAPVSYTHLDVYKRQEYIRNYCTEKKVFPLIEIYQDQERFFGRTRKTVPAVVFLALPGVSGLKDVYKRQGADRSVYDYH